MSGKYILEDIICRFLRTKGYTVYPCSSCIGDWNEGGYAIDDYDVGKGRLAVMSCTTRSAWEHYIEENKNEQRS